MESFIKIVYSSLNLAPNAVQIGTRFSADVNSESFYTYENCFENFANNFVYKFANKYQQTLEDPDKNYVWYISSFE